MRCYFNEYVSLDSIFFETVLIDIIQKKNARTYSLDTLERISSVSACCFYGDRTIACSDHVLASSHHQSRLILYSVSDDGVLTNGTKLLGMGTAVIITS